MDQLSGSQYVFHLFEVLGHTYLPTLEQSNKV
jgi:hypothetical protein